MGDDPQEVAGIADPAERARVAGEHVQRHQRLMTEYARVRRDAIDELRSQGLSYAAVAEALGVSRARVAQLRAAGPPPERSFLGTDIVTIAIPARPVPGRVLPVVAAEDLRAAEELAAFARSLGLETSVVHIPPDGPISFDAAELIVICGPKNSPDARALLDQNPLYDIREENDGRWAIVDRASGQRFLSPLDDDAESGEDVAYVARVPRPEGGRTALHIAGIHAIGSLGAVRYLSQNLPDLHSTVRREPFSLVVRCRADERLDILETELLIPPRRH